jgi:hypothetical protein
MNFSTCLVLNNALTIRDLKTLLETMENSRKSFGAISDTKSFIQRLFK